MSSLDGVSFKETRNLEYFSKFKLDLAFGWTQQGCAYYTYLKLRVSFLTVKLYIPVFIFYPFMRTGCLTQNPHLAER